MDIKFVAKFLGGNGLQDGSYMLKFDLPHDIHTLIPRGQEQKAFPANGTGEVIQAANIGTMVEVTAKLVCVNFPSKNNPQYGTDILKIYVSSMKPVKV